MAYGHDSTAKPGREGDAWRKVKAQLKKRPGSHICWVCGERIDMGLPHGDPRAWTADHVQGIANGGSPLDLKNLMPAHRECNIKRSNNNAPKPKFRASRNW